MSQEKLSELLNYILLGATTSGAGAVTFIQNLTGIGAIIVQCISIITFICFFLINQDKIEMGWRKFKNRFKRN